MTKTSTKKRKRTSPLYLHQMDQTQISHLTTEQLKALRVPNTADKFTLTRRLYDLAEPLNLTTQQTHEAVIDLRQEYQQRRILRGICKDLDKYIKYVLRWRCRGLSHEQAKSKAVVDATVRLDWLKQQKKYWG